MKRVIVLDSGILSLATQRRGVVQADACRRWISACMRAGAVLRVPAIANYETRRELLRAGKRSSVQRLDAFLVARPERYIPISDDDLYRAAEMWADSRRRGLPTSDPKQLDADVILAAQALNLGIPADDLVVAPTNVRHLSRFLDARLWTAIDPNAEA
jgi:predicted nucleic acid-binding protein